MLGWPARGSLMFRIWDLSAQIWQRLKYPQVSGKSNSAGFVLFRNGMNKAWIVLSYDLHHTCIAKTPSNQWQKQQRSQQIFFLSEKGLHIRPKFPPSFRNDGVSCSCYMPKITPHAPFLPLYLHITILTPIFQFLASFFFFLFSFAYHFFSFPPGHIFPQNEIGQ